MREAASRIRLVFAAHCPEARLFRDLIGPRVTRPAEPRPIDLQPLTDKGCKAADHRGRIGYGAISENIPEFV